MTLAHTGRAGVVDSVVRCQRLARLLANGIDRSDDLELLAPVETSVVAFRYVGRGTASPDALDGLNRAIIAAVQEAGRCFITGALVGGREALRACFLNPETTEDDLEVILREVRRAAATLLAADGGSPND